MTPGQMKTIVGITTNSVPTNMSKTEAHILGQGNTLAGELKKFWYNLSKKDRLVKISLNSKTFEPTGLLLVPACDEEMVSKESQKLFWEPVYKRELERGAYAHNIEPSLQYYPPGEKIPAVKEFETVIYRLKETKYHGQVLQNSEASKIKRIYNYAQARCILRESILQGEVDVAGVTMVVYFKSEVGNQTQYLLAYRSSDDDNYLTFSVGGVIETDRGVRTNPAAERDKICFGFPQK